jgi:hypothetical protein
MWLVRGEADSRGGPSEDDNARAGGSKRPQSKDKGANVTPGVVRERVIELAGGARDAREADGSAGVCLAEVRIAHRRP